MADLRVRQRAQRRRKHNWFFVLSLRDAPAVDPLTTARMRRVAQWNSLSRHLSFLTDEKESDLRPLFSQATNPFLDIHTPHVAICGPANQDKISALIHTLENKANSKLVASLKLIYSYCTKHALPMYVDLALIGDGK